MELEVSAEAKDKRLNRMIAVTVVVLSVFTGLCNIKDGNIVQAMQQAQANAVDGWNEYQSNKLKLHLAQESRRQITALATPANQDRAAQALAAADADARKYQAESAGLAAQAKGYASQYDALNVHDDQFDASDALIATAISLAAVAALVESRRLLTASWGFGGFGVFMGVCGFAGWGFHPDVLSNFLG